MRPLHRLRNAFRLRNAIAQEAPVAKSAGAGAGAGAAAAAAAAGKSQEESGSGKTKAYVTGVTVATLSMLAVLHARRLYEDKQNELAVQQGRELEFSPDKKAAFLQILPLRFISRMWGNISSLNLPVWARPVIYKSWARAFHTNLDEVPLPLEEYPTLRDFFGREMKEGLRPLDAREGCLLSPVDGIVLRYGRVTQPGAKVEQVKGFTYTLAALLGTEPVTHGPRPKDPPPPPKPTGRRFFFWSSQPKVDQPSSELLRELHYCVLYLGPGDYHRVHSPSNWCIESRRHFSGNLLPVNHRAVRTIKDLYVQNERVVLEGDWNEGYMAMALVGATNTGSISLKLEPELATNALELSEPDVKNNCGYCVRKGSEVATFNMGSTVVMVFEAPAAEQNVFGVVQDPYPGFKFSVARGERIKMGQAMGTY